MHMAFLKFSYPLRLFNCSCKCHFAAQGRGGYMKISFANNSSLTNVDLFTFSRKLQCDVWSLALAWRISKCLKGWWCCASTCLHWTQLDIRLCRRFLSHCEMQALSVGEHVSWASDMPPKSRLQDVNIDFPDRVSFLPEVSRTSMDGNGCHSNMHQ